MIKRPLSPGERVRVFSHYGQYDGEVTAVGVRGNTPRGFVDGLIRVRNSDGEEWLQHPRQCVRLRSKAVKPAEKRAEVFTGKFAAQNLKAGNFYSSPGEAQREYKIGFSSVVRLVELKPGEKPLSRADIIRPLRSEGFSALQVAQIAKALGLEGK